MQVGEFTLLSKEGRLLAVGEPVQVPRCRRAEGGSGGTPSASSPVCIQYKASVPPKPCGVLGHFCLGWHSHVTLTMRID